VTNDDEASCKRPYSLGKRLEGSGNKRTAVLDAARAQLESGGYASLTMESLAHASGITRQTVHNLFGTKAGVLEALFDRLAVDGGMEQMAVVMLQGDQGALLEGFVKVFVGFWSRDRVLVRRIHGIAAIDPEFGAAVEARNLRRRMAVSRIVDRVAGGADAGLKEERIAALWAMTSFGFFDAMAESLGDTQRAADAVLTLVRSLMMAQAPDVCS